MNAVAFVGVALLVIVTPGQDTAPQFAHSFVPVVALGLVFCTLTFVWLSIVAKLGAVVRASRVFDAVTGAALVAFGARLAAGQGH
jgi:threonine/homoserine/homoserine lactone efflux protein